VKEKGEEKEKEKEKGEKKKRKNARMKQRIDCSNIIVTDVVVRFCFV